jgi:hypothetical protein
LQTEVASVYIVSGLLPAGKEERRVISRVHEARTKRPRAAFVALVLALGVAAALLPVEALAIDGRAFELVSPSAKNGGEVTIGSGSIRAAAGGRSVLFDSNVPSGDVRGTGVVGVVTYRADRGKQAWGSHALMPRQEVNPFALLNGAAFDIFAQDLSRGVLRANDPGLMPGAPTGVMNLYLTDGNGKAEALLTPSVNPVVHSATYSPVAVDASNDFTRVAFESSQNLTADAPPQDPFFCGVLGFCAPRLYIWSAGNGVRLAGVLPNGTAAPEGSVAGPPGGVLTGADGDQTFSDDGSRLYFSSPWSSGSLLYLRKNEASTVWVSQSEASSPDAASGPAAFVGASADGTRALFITSEHLLDADHNTSDDLYMYTDSADPEHDANLTLLSEDNEPADDSVVDGALGVSADGLRVYFAAEGQLVAGAPLGAGPKLYLWDHGTLKYITRLFDASVVDDGPNWSKQAIVRTSRVSSDGRYLVYTTAAPQVGGFDTAGHKEIYRYDAVTQEVTCISCGPGHGPATADASINYPGATATAQYSAYASRALADGGARIFFNTAETLSAGDTNGKVDAYEWENGGVHLISTGRSDSEAYLVDASENGHDAFFVTRERLVAWDDDNLQDLYDARVGGGLPEPPDARRPCDGESCQGPLHASTPIHTPSTSAVVARARHAHSGRVVIARVGQRQLRRWARRGEMRLRVEVQGTCALSVGAEAQYAGTSHPLRRIAERSNGSREMLVRVRLPRVALSHLANGEHLRVIVAVRCSRNARREKVRFVLSPPGVRFGGGR